jgi:hypothetical protein
MSLASRLIHDTEPAETVGDLADGLGARDGTRSDIVQPENVGEKLKLAAPQELLNTAADGGAASAIARHAVLLQGLRAWKHCVKHTLIVQKMQTPQVGRKRPRAGAVGEETGHLRGQG